MRPSSPRNLMNSTRTGRTAVFFCAIAGCFAAVVIGSALAARQPSVFAAQSQSASVPAQQSQSATSPNSAVRFDMLVRDDFFAGLFHGDKARFARALKFTEDALAKDPKNGDAWVWFGSAHLQLSGEAYSAGDSAKGKELWDRGLAEMDKGVALNPDDVGVHIGRGAPLLGIASSGYDPNDAESRALVTKAVADYEFALAKQAPVFKTLGRHARGELLFGLVSGYSMLGNDAKAREYLRRIVTELPKSPYATEADSLLAKNPLGIVQHQCIGCHVD